MMSPAQTAGLGHFLGRSSIALLLQKYDSFYALSSKMDS